MHSNKMVLLFDNLRRARGVHRRPRFLADPVAYLAAAPCVRVTGPPGASIGRSVASKSSATKACPRADQWVSVGRYGMLPAASRALSRNVWRYCSRLRGGG